MSVQATKEHCKVCFDSLLSVFNGKQLPKWPTSLPDIKTPLFVTWKIKGHLRGCIGTFSPDFHSKLLPQYSIVAATQDHRFKPMTAKQLTPDLMVYVSLLVNFQEAKDIYDWEVGKHGIIIKANYQGEYYSATYLPEVASQQGWGKKETLVSLLRKADYDGELDDIKDHIKLTRYQSSKASLGYEQYLKMQK